MAEPGPKLSEVFDEIWKNYEFLDRTDDSTCSEAVQGKVKTGMEKCEQGIKMVNDLNLFSINEEIEEVATTELRYLLLPGLLAYITNKNTKAERMDVVKKSQGYYLDFLKLCKLYQVCDFDLPRIAMEEEEEQGEKKKKPSSKMSGPEDFLSMADRRKVKMERFKIQKETEARLKELYDKVNQDHVDDEVKREYYNTLLTRWIHYSLEELDSIKDELPILEHMAKMRLSGAAPPSQEKQSNKPKSNFRPFILTKDALQKQVIGAGYPSLPTYSVEEWYDQQVVAGRLPGPGEKMPMPDPAAEAKEYERQDLEKEKNIEDDDAETIRKAREWDEWRDDHRRGWGNRQNMG